MKKRSLLDILIILFGWLSLGGALLLYCFMQYAKTGEVLVVEIVFGAGLVANGILMALFKKYSDAITYIFESPADYYKERKDNKSK